MAAATAAQLVPESAVHRPRILEVAGPTWELQLGLRLIPLFAASSQHLSAQQDARTRNDGRRCEVEQNLQIAETTTVREMGYS